MSTLSSRDLNVTHSSDTTSRFTLSYVWFAVAMTVLTGVYVSYRVYQQMYGMSAGLDSTEPSTSIPPNGTSSQTTATSAADSGSAQVNKLVRCGPMVLTASK